MNQSAVVCLIALGGILPSCGNPKPSSKLDRVKAELSLPQCDVASSESCEQALTEISDILGDQNKSVIRAFDELDMTAQLSLNHAIERYWLIASGTDSPDARGELDKKYQLLEKLAREDGTHRRAESRSPFIYHPLELEAVKKAFSRYGVLSLSPRAVRRAGEKFKTIEVDRPWAGYWYPRSDRRLFEGAESPLAKFDRLAAGRGLTSEAAKWQEKQRLIGSIESWEGLCYAWALASALSPEPRAPVTVDGIEFAIKDQKALLTLLHERVPVEMYGTRYLGDASTDGTYQDLRPEVFHKIITSELGHFGRPVVMDNDAGIEVWEQPIYRFTWQITPDPEIKHAYRVLAKASVVKPRQQGETNDLTNVGDVVAIPYEYRLYVAEGGGHDDYLKVIAGEWLGQSFHYHPDFFVVPAKQPELDSRNPELSKHRELAAEILKANDSPTDSHDAVAETEDRRAP